MKLPRGFSLVELVIVITIIGVLAAIAIPRLARASAGAREAALRKDLAALRNAIEAYASEHGGTFPGRRADGKGNGAGSPAAFKNQLTLFSNEKGQVSEVREAAHSLGRYLTRIPLAPVGANRGSDVVAIDTTNPMPVVTAGPAGWVYNPTTGHIIANSADKNEAKTNGFDAY